ncbi:NAD(P)-dependent alcohol dehydrogenase [Nocardioides panacis]|uniref:NAD(P)-dependent alcohol dehydrogenase n=1 Tax=Nocardioides panacis TaxID=2849501 RepID=A0A975SYB2_9ACTN|nr:NAD(P)-dependent alcohol dehydrogenase [Nocardioides panacis]QWZ08037.1 NAD(P)-dependent alcohol dehydrogenase [Nocardioides panacis]
MSTMRACVLRSPGDLVIEERPVPDPARHEVQVRVTAVGVCGSDVHYFQHGRIGDFVVESPMVLGHESAGVVIGVGADVDPSRIGQRVSLEPGVPDLTCAQCRAGKYNLCPGMRFFATPPIDGSLAEVVTLHAGFAYPVPDSISDDAAALLEPLSVGVWANQKAHVGPGSRVLVTGAGAIGLVAAQCALAFGAQEVVVADINPHRLELARELGATAVLDSGSGSVADSGFEPDVLLECSGHSGVTDEGLRSLARAGRAVLVGMGGDELAVPLGVIQSREIQLTGTFRYANTWPTAIGLAASGRVSLDRLVTGHFPLKSSEDALLAATVDARAVKSIINPQH